MNRFFQYSDLFEKNKIKILGHSENYESEKVFLKYKEKNLQYIYFEKNQYELFIKLVYTEIEKEIKSSHTSLDDDICLHLDGVQIIHEYLSFDHAARDLQIFTDNMASSILNIFKKNNFEKIKNLILAPHPSSQLAIMTSYLSCFMLKLTEPNINDELYTSFIKASLFMDGSLKMKSW